MNIHFPICPEFLFIIILRALQVHIHKQELLKGFYYDWRRGVKTLMSDIAEPKVNVIFMRKYELSERFWPCKNMTCLTGKLTTKCC